MTEIEEILIANLERQGQCTIEDIGGFSALKNNAETIADSPLMDEFLQILSDYSLTANSTELNIIEDIFKISFERNTNPIAIRNSILILSRNALKLAGCFDTLIKIAGESTRSGFIRGHILQGAFEIAVHNTAKKYHLIGFLLQVGTEEDEEFLIYASKIIGICYSVFENEDLHSKLEELVRLGKGADDSLYENAMAYLIKGLNATNAETGIANFDQAMGLFERASAHERLDATVYKLALLVLRSFAASNPAQGLKLQVEELTKAIAIYSTWYSYKDQYNWVNLRHSEIQNWYALSDYLATTSEQLSAPAWLEPITVIEKYLLTIYDCSRSLFKRTASGGLELLLRPVIRASFIEQSERAYLLERWINLKNDPDLTTIGEELKADILRYRSAWTKGNEVGVVPKPEQNTTPGIHILASAHITSFDKFVANYKAEQITDVSIILRKKFDELVAGLGEIVSYGYPEVKREFDTLLYHTLRFLELRMDNTAANFPKARYLFQNQPLPLEEVLQADYHDYMQPIALRGRIRLEQMDVAGGRADVFFDYLSFSFCVEVKRELLDATFESIRKKFLGQAKEYQNTTAKVGILLVLDLVDKPNGIGSLESNVKLEITSSATDPEPRGVIVVKVPGNRVTPSRMH